jgi:hypothetical protein
MHTKGFTSFLEFLVTELLGPGILRPGDQHPRWDCPYCSRPDENFWHQEFRVAPPQGDSEIKWHCFGNEEEHRRNGWRLWGDELDLVMHVHKVGKASAKIILAELWDTYKRTAIAPPNSERKRIADEVQAEQLARSLAPLSGDRRGCSAEQKNNGRSAEQ